MPRIARIAKSTPAAEPRGDHEDEYDDFARPSVHKLGSAAADGVQRPAGVAASAFDAGRVAAGLAAPAWKTKPKRRLHTIDIDAITIERGVPPPAAKRDQVTLRYVELVGRMKVGDSVLLNHAIGRRLYTVAKRLGCTARTNVAEPGMLRVWLMSKPAPGAAVAPKAAPKAEGKAADKRAAA